MTDLSSPSATPAEPTWHRFSAAAQCGKDSSVVNYGTALPSETELKLLGTVESKRILDLGCGIGANAVALAQQGAKVIAVDPSTTALNRVRERAETAEVRVELHQGELAELPFLRSDSIDAAISVMALSSVDDLARVFRQVHRVLKPEAPLVMSVPHPAFNLLDPKASDPLRVARAYDDSSPVEWELNGEEIVDYPRTFSTLFTTLARANFRVDQVIEPTANPSAAREDSYADAMRLVPATLVLRARKQGN